MIYTMPSLHLPHSKLHVSEVLSSLQQGPAAAPVHGSDRAAIFKELEMSGSVSSSWDSDSGQTGYVLTNAGIK